MELQDHLAVAGRIGIQPGGKEPHEGRERIRAGHHVFLVEFLGCHPFGNAGFPEKFAHLGERRWIHERLGDPPERFSGNRHGLHQFPAGPGGGIQDVPGLILIKTGRHIFGRGPVDFRHDGLGFREEVVRPVDRFLNPWL